jgi:DNA-binding transcriptional LysR family regulator
MGNNKNFDLVRALECYVNTLQIGSMSETARKLGITQSAVSQQIKNLETILGTQLLDRSLRPIRPTGDGAQLLDRAEKFLIEATQILSSSRNQPLVQLRLNMLGSFSQILSPHIVPLLREKLAVRNIIVASGLATAHRNAILNRETDLALTSDPVLELDSLERHDILVEPFVLLLPSSRGGLHPNLSDLAAELPFIRYHSNSPIGVKIETHLRRQRFSIEKWCEFDSPDSVVATVEKGCGWTITTPMHALQGVRDWTRLRCLPLPRPGMSRSTVLLSRSGELRGIPPLIAATARQVIKDNIIPQVRERLPFLQVSEKLGGAIVLTASSGR